MTRGRFAPSPTGRMHLGNVFCALLSWLSAKSKGGKWVLRIEDLDPQRSRREYALQLMDDLQWLGLPWDGEPVWQSQRGHIYEEYLHRLQEMGLTYPCYCTRADIMATQAPHETDGRVVYKGTCRPKSTDAARSVPTATSLTPQTVPLRQGDERSGGGRLTANHSPFNVKRSPLTALLSPPETGGVPRSGEGVDSPFTANPSTFNIQRSTFNVIPATTRLIVPDCIIPFTDGHYGQHDINLAEHCGDYIIRRKDGAWAYQLAVVVDDALMGVTEIVRGRDLLLSSPQQIHLRELLFGERKTENGELRVSESISMAGTLRAASENEQQSGRCTQRPYIAARELIQDHEAGLKRKTDSFNVNPSPLTTLLSPPETGGVPQSGEGVDNSLTPHPSPLTVNFFHHPLLCNAEGQRLCKRDKSMDLGYLRDKGTTPQEIIGLLAHLAGLTNSPAPVTPQELIPLFSWDKVLTEDIILNNLQEAL